jgi:hypothetical protein
MTYSHTSEERELYMASLYKHGLHLRQVGSAMGVSLQTVWFVLRRLGIECRSSGDHNRGRKQSPEHIRKVIEARKGFRFSHETRRQMSESAKRRGTTNNFFVDGRGQERATARRQEMDALEYRLWREAVFKRDEYVCQSCQKRGGRLHADHIKGWALHPELRYELSNGRTLCVACHKVTPTYGVHAGPKLAAF